MSIIALIGLPGSGKSTISKQLARVLSFQQLDTDSLIEEFVGCSVAQYFAREGENAFRELETQTLQELVSVQRDVVLATGGGIVLRAENRALLHQHCFVVYLRAQPAQLYQRLKHDRSRPLLQNTDMQQRLQELYVLRHPLYTEVAHCFVDSAQGNAHVLVEEIAQQFAQGKPHTPIRVNQ